MTLFAAMRDEGSLRSIGEQLGICEMILLPPEAAGEK